MFQLKSVEDYLLFAKKTTLWTFLVGSFIILLYFLSHYNGIIYISLFFITAAFIINTTIAFVLIYNLIKNTKLRKNIVFTILLMTINIPIGIYYIDLGFTLYNKLTNV